MSMFEVQSPECPGCSVVATFVMTWDQYSRVRKGEHLQHVLPHWSAEDREQLISGTCPSCWDEMFPDEEDDYYEDDSLYAIDPESDLYEYDRDYYVDFGGDL